MDGIEARYEEIRTRVAAACDKAGRALDDVSILAVSKGLAPDVINEAADCGLVFFGESKIQEAKQKIPLCSSLLEWHMIGHLQSNKVRDAVHLFSLIHSVDSLKLLEMINTESGNAGKTMTVFLEVNVSGEGSKFGMAENDVAMVLSASEKMMNVDVAGLMTMPPFNPDPESSREYFSHLREFRDVLKEETGFPLEHLSMGMSNDFEVAVEEGATWLRIGTGLLGDRRK